MNPVAAAGVLTAIALLGACSEPARNAYQGYAEGEYVFVALPYAGTLEKLPVQRGQQVAEGAPLFALEQAAEQAATREAEARLNSAEARLTNLQGGRRKAELDVVRAQSASAVAAQTLSDTQLRQQEQLYGRGFISRSRLDEAKASHDRDAARVAEAEAQFRNARQSIGREAEISAARAETDAARAQLAQAQWRLAQKNAAAPTAALVQDTFFSQGEWVPAGAPVLSLLPPGNIKLRFFAPEAVVGSLKTGQAVSIACSGCATPVPARISFIAPQAEYTPPVIYSKESRAKLVFLVEAKPASEDAVRLHPGQPVDVTLEKK